MSIKSPRALWENYSAATVGIAKRFGRVKSQTISSSQIWTRRWTPK